MRLTLRTNLAARVLMFCAVNDGRKVRSADIAEYCNASVNHLLQVVSLLQVHGFVATARGRSGGLQLALPMEQISIGSVFRIFEGELPLTECFDPAGNTCPLAGTCRLRDVLIQAQEAFYQALDRVTLADLVQGNCGLAGLLTLGDALQARCPHTSGPAASSDDPTISRPPTPMRNAKRGSIAALATSIGGD